MAQTTKKILIAGDSFAAVWPKSTIGWVNLLERHFDVENIAQAGVGEYKIYKQIKNTNLKNFDIAIISHTSPSRIHVNHHPLHKSGFHQNCDLIYNDICDRFSFPGQPLYIAQKWFDYFYDDDYQLEIYTMLREKILSLVDIPYISLSHIDVLKNFNLEPIHIDFSDLWKNHRGSDNHYDSIGNKIIFNKIIQEIGKL